MKYEKSSGRWSVLYHKNCSDGFCAAWVASLFLPNDTHFEAVGYYEELPKNLYENVLIVDFSYPREVLLELKKTHNVVVLDHHKSAAEQLEGLEFCEFDMERSGAMMAWDFFSDGRTPPPWLVSYVQDRDLWRWELLDSKAINTYIGSLDNTFEAWNLAYRSAYGDVVKAGYDMLAYKNKLVERIVENNAYRAMLNGHIVWCVNIAFLQSEIGNRLAERGEFSFTYADTPDGKIKYSLRVADTDFDVSDLARNFPGGGGHKKAAGFTVDKKVHKRI